MATGPDAHGLKILLHETAPGSLATVRDVWPDAQTLAAFDQTSGFADQMSQNNDRMVICDVTSTNSTNFQIIQALRQLHPELPLVAFLPEPSLALAITAFRNDVDDVLTPPLDKKTLLDTWKRISGRQQQKLASHLQEKNREVELDYAALVKRYEDRTRFVCNLSHELKSPLTSVLGFADLMHNFHDQVDHARLRDYVARIYDKGKQLEQRLTGMLRLFSLDSGNEPLQPHELSLRDAIPRVLQRHEDDINTKELDLRLKLQDDLLPVSGDQDNLDLLLDALIDNAVKFNRTGGLLSIHAENILSNGDPMVYLRIFNQGQSVPGEYAEDIFQGCSPTGEPDSDMPRRVGLGLATCRAILRRMGGEIYLEPDEDGKGTSIALLMPTGTTEMELNHG